MADVQNVIVLSEITTPDGIPYKRKRSPSPGLHAPWLSDKEPSSTKYSVDTVNSDPATAHSATVNGSHRNGERRPYERTSRPFIRTTLPDVDTKRAIERERQLQEAASRHDNVEKAAFDAKAEYQKLLSTRAGGVYVPPARLRALQEAMQSDKSSMEYQRLAWDNLKKGINGLINKANIPNIQQIVLDLFKLNIVRGKGLFCRSIMKAQAASLPFTSIFACMTAVINTKLPEIGELLVTRLVVQFRKAYKRNDKAVCLASSTFLAQLVNQRVAHDLVALEILFLLLNRATDDSVEVAVGFMKEVGLFLKENSSKSNNTIYERFRTILHEGMIDKRVQYMIEVLFQVRKESYKNYPIIPEGLDLVEEDDQITHQIELDDELDIQDTLGVFYFDADYEEHEKEYEAARKEILDEDSDDNRSDSDESNPSDEDDEEANIKTKDSIVEIEDQTNQNIVNLRRKIYLTIMSSVDFEECVHKLLKLGIKEGQEIELCNMIIECCAQERTYGKFYGLIGERFCKINMIWQRNFHDSFVNYYDTIHRYETNKLRNISKFFAHLLISDAIDWQCLGCIRLTESDTTSSSRIFIKILFEELIAGLGQQDLKAKLSEDSLQDALAGLFPRDMPKNTRFSINYFTAIGLGALTDGMREDLQKAEALAKEKQAQLLQEERAKVASGRGRRRSRSLDSRSSYTDSRSGSYSYSSYSSRSRSGSYSSYTRSSYSRSPSPRRDHRATQASESRGRMHSNGQSKSAEANSKRRSPTPDFRHKDRRLPPRSLSPASPKPTSQRYRG